MPVVVVPWLIALAVAHYTVKALDSTADLVDSTATLSDSLTRLAVVGAVGYVGYAVTKQVIK